MTGNAIHKSAATTGPSRRRVVQGLSAFAAASALPGTAFAQAAGARRLVIVQLNGGMDGLALLPPTGDPDYASLRGPLAFPAAGDINGPITLDGRFGLHPAAAPLLRFWLRGELAILPAIGSPEPVYSHTRARERLAGLREAEGGRITGWLGRALALSGATAGGGRGATTLAASPPMLAGAPAIAGFNPLAFPDRVPGMKERLDLLYRADPGMQELREQAMAERAWELEGLGEDHLRSDRGAPDAVFFRHYAAAAGRMLAAENGPRVAVLELSGFDTHARQGVLDGPLARRIAGMTDGLTALVDGLGDAWAETAILVVSEFGRTARPNAKLGTDHGVAGVALVLSPRLVGGGITGDWPGLGEGDLADGRGVKPTASHIALFAAALTGHLNLPPGRVDGEVFTEGGRPGPFSGLFL